MLFIGTNFLSHLATNVLLWEVLNGFGESLTVGGSRCQLQMTANLPKDHALTLATNISSAMVVNGASPLMQRSVGQPFKIYHNVMADLRCAKQK